MTPGSFRPVLAPFLFVVIPLVLAALPPLASGLPAPAATASPGGQPPRNLSPSADRSAAEALAAAVQEAILSRDVDGILRHYDLGDSAAAARKRAEYAGAVGLDSLSCSLRVGSFEAAGDSAQVPLFWQLIYRDNGRTRTQLGWSTWVLRPRSAGNWYITREAEREYVRTVSTDLSVHLEPDSSLMSGTARIRLAATQPGESALILQLNRGLRVGSVRDGIGKELSFDQTADAVVVSLEKALARGDSLEVSVRFRGGLFNETAERGYSQVSIAPAGSFASWVTSWYPRLPGTAGKSTGTIRFDVPSGLIVASSGRQVPDAADDKRAVDGEGAADGITAANGMRAADGMREEVTFRVDSPLDFSFAAARYYHRERTIDGVNIGVYFLRGGEEKADLYEKGCARLLAFERRLYGMYPFDSYAIVEIPPEACGALGGSSEQGMNLFPAGILPDSTFPLALLGHEMGHSWWGNYLSGADGAVIDEALSQLTAALAVREFEGERALRTFLKYGRPDYPQSARQYFLQFGLASDRDLPLLPSPGTGNASSQHDLADVKGHFVYDMLRQSLGDSAFVGGLRTVIREHPRGSVRLADLQSAWERSSGTDLDAFFRQWFHRTGAPELALRDSVVVREGKRLLEGSVRQLRQIYSVEVELVLVDGPAGDQAGRSGPRVVRLVLDGPETPFSIELGNAPRAVLLDPDYKVFRWVDEFRDVDARQEVECLQSLGRQEEARKKLDGLLEGVKPQTRGESGDLPAGGGPGRRPEDAADLHYLLGLGEEASGRLESAEKEYRLVTDAFALYPAFNPWIPLSMLHLGYLCDRQGRRDEALGWYRRVLDLPDTQGSRKAARRGLLEPSAAPPRLAPPGEEAIRNIVGSYAGPAFGNLEVSTEHGEPMVQVQALGQHSRLAWLHDDVYRVLANDGVTVEFLRAGSAPAAEMVVRAAGMEYRLVRREQPE